MIPENDEALAPKAESYITNRTAKRGFSNISGRQGSLPESSLPSHRRRISNHNLKHKSDLGQELPGIAVHNSPRLRKLPHLNHCQQSGLAPRLRHAWPEVYANTELRLNG